MSRPANKLKIKYRKPKKDAAKPVSTGVTSANDPNVKKFSALRSKSMPDELQLFKRNKFLRVAAILFLFTAVFIAGVKLGPFLTNLKYISEADLRTAATGNNLLPGSAGLTASPALASPLPKIVISGKVTAITTLQIEVTDADGIPYNLGYNSMSVLISPQDMTLDFSELKTGDNVTVRANRSPDGNLTAERVKILSL